MSKTKKDTQTEAVAEVKVEEPVTWPSSPLADASKSLVQTFTRDWMQNCCIKQLALVKDDLKMQVEAEVTDAKPEHILNPETAKLLIAALRANMAFYQAVAPSTEGTRRKVQKDAEEIEAELSLIVDGKMKPLDKAAAEAAAAKLEELRAAQAAALAEMAALEASLKL